MENMTRKVERMVRKNAKRRAWRRFVAVPAAIVVFVTTYALILPAIAMERDTYCGFEAHQHTEECYTAQLSCGYEDGQVLQSAKTVTELACTASAHQHTEDCFNEYGEIVCGQADYLVHEHNADCYNEAGQLVCPLPEVKAHTHDASCYVTEIVNVCGLEESAGHVHDESCYTVVSHPELICGQEESAGHVHDASCYTTTEHTYLACGQEESEGHIHDASCYTVTVAEDGTETMELTCGQMETIGHTHTADCYVTEQVTELTCTLPESAGHTHTDACWADVQSVELTCGKEESAGHTHTDACFAEQSVLICDKPEVIPHVHGDECYTVTVAEDGTEVRELTCPLTVVESHQHTAECFTTYEMTVETVHQHTDLCYIHVLTCTLPEHEHTEECYQAPEEPETTEVPAAPEMSAEPAEGDTAEPEVSAEPAEGDTAEPEVSAEPAEGDTAEPEVSAEPVEGDTAEPETSAEPAEGDTAEPEASAEPAEGDTAEPEASAEPAEDEATEEPDAPQFICGMEEHTHTETCYDEAGELVCQIEEHTHDETCLPVEITGDELSPVEPEYICGKEEHTHDEACYDENGELVCQIEEHTHDETCLPVEITGDELSPVEPEYICGKEEHTHDEACYDENGELVCQIEEHTHDETCLAVEITDGGVEIDEDEIPHFEMPILVCGMEEHVHSTNCMDQDMNYACGLTQHTHTGECYDIPGLGVHPLLVCDKHEHFHTEACYNEAGELICGREAHLHDVDCFELPRGDFMTMDLDGIILMALDDGVHLDDYVDSVAGGTLNYDPTTGAYTTDLTVNFTIPNSELANVYTYKIPKDVILPEGLLSERIPVEFAGGVAGYCTVTQDEDGGYTLRMELTEEYVKEAEKLPSSNSTGHFTLRASKVVVESEHDADVYFGVDHLETGHLHITWNKNNVNYEYKVKKSKVDDQSKDGTIHYRIEVYSKTGTPGNITLNDELTTPDANIPSLEGPKNVTVKRYERLYDGGNYNFVEDVDFEEPSVDKDGKFGMTLPPLPHTDGTYEYAYVVEYDYTYDPKEVEGKTVKFHNDADTTSDELKGHGDVDVTVDGTVVDKQAVQEGSRIKWTITVNKGKFDINGWTLDDTFFNGNLITEEGNDLTISPDKGYEIKKNGDYVDGIVFTADSEGKNCNQYTITYYTDAKPGEKVENDVTVHEDETGRDHHDHADVDVSGDTNPGDWPENKEFKGLEAAGDVRHAKWSVDLDIPLAGIKQGAVAEDKIEAANGGYSHWMTKEQAQNLYDNVRDQAWAKKVDWTFQIWDGSNLTICTPDELSSLGADVKIVGFKWVAKDVIYPADGEPRDKIHVEYETTVGANDHQEFKNTFNGHEVKFENKPDSVEKTLLDDKSNADETTRELTSLDDIFEWKVTTRFGAEHQSMDVVDKLPEQVELVGIYFKIVYNGWTFAGEINESTGLFELYHSDKLGATGNYDRANNTVTLHFEKENLMEGGNALGSGERDHIDIVYQCKLKDDVKEEIEEKLGEDPNFSLKFEANHVDLKLDGKDVGSDEHTLTVTVKEEEHEDEVEGLGKYLANYDKERNSATYTVDIIPPEGGFTAKDPVTGEPVELDDFLTLTDTLRYTDLLNNGGGWTNSEHSNPYFNPAMVEFYLENVKFYYPVLGDDNEPLLDDNGHMTPDHDKQVPASEARWVDFVENKTLHDPNNTQYKEVYDWEKVITAQVANNGKPIVMEYSYRVKVKILPVGGNPGDPLVDYYEIDPTDWRYANGVDFMMENEVTLDGVGSRKEVSKETYEYKYGEASMVTSGFNIYKVETGNLSEKLAGAQFTLHQLVDDGSGKVTDQVVRSGDIDVTATTAAGGYINLSVAKISDGVTTKYYLVIDNGDGNKLQVPIEPNTLYYLVETAAPNGYKFPDDPEKVFVWYPDPDSTEKKQPSDLAGYTEVGGRTVYDLSEVDSVYVENEPSKEDTYVLPETGGMGTGVFTLSGMALIALAGAVFCARRRRAARG